MRKFHRSAAIAGPLQRCPAQERQPAFAAGFDRRLVKPAAPAPRREILD